MDHPSKLEEANHPSYYIIYKEKLGNQQGTLCRLCFTMIRLSFISDQNQFKIEREFV
jgi:hypothetical protein